MCFNGIRGHGVMMKTIARRVMIFYVALQRAQGESRDVIRRFGDIFLVFFVLGAECVRNKLRG